MTEPTGARDAVAGWSAPDRPSGEVPPGPVAPGYVPHGHGIPVPPVPPPPPQRVTLPPGFRPAASPPGVWPPGAPVPGTPAVRMPSGLFPSGPPRPTYREPHPATLGEVALGGAMATLWMSLFGLLAGSAGAYAWWTLGAGLAAWVAALTLARWGMRGIAAGIGLITGLAVAIDGVVIMEHWMAGHWLLW